MLEIVLYLAMLVLVAGTVTSLLLWVVRANNEVYVRNELVQNIEHALSEISSEAREARSVYTPTSVLGSSPGQLSLETTKNPPAGETSTYVDFFLCGTRICVKRESQLPRALTSDKLEIQNLEFTQVQTGSAVSLHIEVEASYRNATLNSRTTVSLRAYD